METSLAPIIRIPLHSLKKSILFTKAFFVQIAKDQQESKQWYINERTVLTMMSPVLSSVYSYCNTHAKKLKEALFIIIVRSYKNATQNTKY